MQENGYSTSSFGKDHNTPAFAASAAGPFDQWPSGMGFEYFYGFVGGDANQWQPNLFRNTTAIYPYVGKPGWNLTTDMRAPWETGKIADGIKGECRGGLSEIEEVK